MVGLPTQLDGTASDQTARVRKMVALLPRLSIPIALQDERLSSHEAEERLALHERDWRKRKAKLDAASAAVILQDYLDAHTNKCDQHSLIFQRRDAETQGFSFFDQKILCVPASLR